MSNRWTALFSLAALPVIAVVSLPVLAQTEIPEVVLDDDVEFWKVDRFLGNTWAGTVFYQGSAREVGGLQRISGITETPEGTYFTSKAEGFDFPNLLRMTDGRVRLVMDWEGLVEGPLELCHGGSPAWNPVDQSLYLTGPNCIRKVSVDADGKRTVSVVAGTPHVAGSDDGPALQATLQGARGWTIAQDGAIYWLELRALRKIADGMVTTLPLTRVDNAEHLWNLGPGGGLSAGENAQTLYISDYYDVYNGYSILRCDLTANTVEQIVGVPADHPNHGQEIDGPALTHAAFRGGARAIYHPDHHALILSGADPIRWRWLKFGGDDWVRTLLGTRRPETEVQPFDWEEKNSLGIDGEQIRFGASAISAVNGVGADGVIYIGSVGELTGAWRAYDTRLADTFVNELQPLPEDAAPGSRIYGLRIGSDGRPLPDAVPFELAPSNTGVQARPNIAYRNGVYLVVWHDMRNGLDFDVLGLRIGSDGTVLDEVPLEIGVGPRTQAMPDVAADDEGFMVVWGGFRPDDVLTQVFAARVSDDGAVGEATRIASGASPQIAWNAQESMHLVVHASHNNSGTTKSYLRLDKQKVVGEFGRYHTVYAARNPGHYSLCAFPTAGEGWAFVTDHQTGNGWGRSLGIQHVINVAPDGEVADDAPNASPFVAESDGTNWLDYSANLEAQWPYGGSAMAADSRYCVAVWSRYQIGGISGISLYNSDLYISRIDGWDPVEDAPIAVATGENSERHPALAGRGDAQMVVAYEELTEQGPRIVTRSLTVGTEIEVGEAVSLVDTNGGQRGFPALAFGEPGSDSYLLVWQEGWYGDYPSLVEATPDIADPGETGADAGSQDSSKLEGRGCSCQTAAVVSSMAWLLMALLAMARRRRHEPL